MSNLPKIGRLERVPLRHVWKNEASDFTRWLRENIDVLNDVLNLTLANPEREQPAGDFAVDLVAEDESGDTVIIENQLERSDHDHLGKLLTYLTSLDAKGAIWIVSDPRPEHVRAVTWLNESTSADFWLVKVEAVQIEGSAPAPLLTRIVGPSTEGKQAGETKRELAARHHARKRFWQQLLSSAKELTDLHASISPSVEGWAATTAGKPGMQWIYVLLKDRARIELYIDRGGESDDWNKAMFDKLLTRKAEAEAAFGGPLEWQRLDGKRACRICKILEDGGLADESRWPQIQAAMIDTMIRFEKALGPWVEKL
jgi:Domain of unknown function (DUF4268)